MANCLEITLWYPEDKFNALSTALEPAGSSVEEERNSTNAWSHPNSALRLPKSWPGRNSMKRRSGCGTRRRPTACPSSS